MVKTRIQEHCSNVRRHRTSTKMTNHYFIKKHTEEEIHWTITEQLTDGKENKLLEYEQRSIYRLSTYTMGLNDDIPWTTLQL